MRVRGTIALVVAGVLASGCGEAMAATPADPAPLRWTLVDTIDGVFPPGDTTAFVAANDEQWEAIWLGVGYPGDRPVVDFADAIAVVWAYGVSGSCDQDSLDDVVLEGTTIAPVFSSPYEPGTTCTADYNPRSRIVAIDRTSLPGLPLEVQTDTVACDGCSLTMTDLSDAAPAAVPLTDEDLAQIVVAAVELRATPVDADPAVPIEIVDIMAGAGGDAYLWLRDGTPLDDTTRARLVDRFAPREVRFVPPSVVEVERDGTTPFAVINVAAPAMLEGRLTVESSLWCGPLCFFSGAHELSVADGRLWSIGEPVGPQTIA